MSDQNKTLYTDVFTGNSISSPVAYQLITLEANPVQLIWPSQDINTISPAGSVNNAVNFYIGNITDITSEIVSTGLIFLPDITLQIKGASFTLVNRTLTGSTINIANYNENLVLSCVDAGVITSYTFYVNNNNNQNGWSCLVSRSSDSI